MIHESELRKRLAQVVQKRVSPVELHDWLLANDWNMHRTAEPQAFALAANVELSLFEALNGDRSHESLMAEFSCLLNNVESVLSDVGDSTRVFTVTKPYLRNLVFANGSSLGHIAVKTSSSSFLPLVAA
jgi:hypothetical protein